MALLAAYSFDESGDTVKDYSGNGNDFSIAGTDGVRNASGKTNGGLSWQDTAGSWPQLPDIGRTANRTVMAWLKNLNLLGTSWAIQFLVPSITSGAWGILWLSSQVHIQARNADGFVRASGTFPDDGAWHHIAGTYDGATVRLYIDGTEASSVALTAPIRTDTDPPLLMRDWNLTTAIMDDVRLYDEARTAAQIVTDKDTPVASTATGVLFAAPLLPTSSITGTVGITGALSGVAPVPTASITGRTAEREWEYPDRIIGPFWKGWRLDARGRAPYPKPADDGLRPGSFPALVHGIGCFGYTWIFACQGTTPLWPHECLTCGAKSDRDATGKTLLTFRLESEGFVRV